MKDIARPLDELGDKKAKKIRTKVVNYALGGLATVSTIAFLIWFLHQAAKLKVILGG